MTSDTKEYVSFAIGIKLLSKLFIRKFHIFPIPFTSNKFLQSGRIHLAKIRLDKGLQVKNYSLNPVNVFGSELAPPSFYLDAEVYRKAKKANVTPDDIWEKMSPAQKQKYLNPTT